MNGLGWNSTLTNLIASPFQATEEQDHAHNAQKAADEINLGDDLFSTETARVGARRGEVKEERAEEANCVPHAHEDAAISPATVRRDQLCPEDGWAERNNGKDQD